MEVTLFTVFSLVQQRRLSRNAEKVRCRRSVFLCRTNLTLAEKSKEYQIGPMKTRLHRANWTSRSAICLAASWKPTGLNLTVLPGASAGGEKNTQSAPCYFWKLLSGLGIKSWHPGPTLMTKDRPAPFCDQSSDKPSALNRELPLKHPPPLMLLDQLVSLPDERTLVLCPANNFKT